MQVNMIGLGVVIRSDVESVLGLNGMVVMVVGLSSTQVVIVCGASELVGIG